VYTVGVVGRLGACTTRHAVQTRYHYHDLQSSRRVQTELTCRLRLCLNCHFTLTLRWSWNVIFGISIICLSLYESSASIYGNRPHIWIDTGSWVEWIEKDWTCQVNSFIPLIFFYVVCYIKVLPLCWNVLEVTVFMRSPTNTCSIHIGSKQCGAEFYRRWLAYRHCWSFCLIAIEVVRSLIDGLLGYLAWKPDTRVSGMSLNCFISSKVWCLVDTRHVTVTVNG
jgi:hypothetical protein